MTDQIRQHADTVSEHFAVKKYLVNYRIASAGDAAGKGDRAERYEALCEALKPMAGYSFKNFDDDGHHSTSSWIIHVSKTAEQVGVELEKLLVERHDFLAIFEISEENNWSMPEADGDRAQTTRI